MISANRAHSSPWKLVFTMTAVTDCDRLEKLIRESLAKQDQERIKQIIDQLCHEYAYDVHQAFARNGGLIGLAAASIALGSVSAWGQKIEELPNAW